MAVGWRKKCDYCKRPFAAKRPHAKFCGPACKSRSRRRRGSGSYEFICIDCLERFTALSPKAQRCGPCAKQAHRNRAKLYQRRRRAADRAAWRSVLALGPARS